jgi:hypothetical protein
VLSLKNGITLRGLISIIHSGSRIRDAISFVSALLKKADRRCRLVELFLKRETHGDNRDFEQDRDAYPMVALMEPQFGISRNYEVNRKFKKEPIYSHRRFELIPFLLTSKSIFIGLVAHASGSKGIVAGTGDFPISCNFAGRNHVDGSLFYDPRAICQKGAMNSVDAHCGLQLDFRTSAMADYRSRLDLTSLGLDLSEIDQHGLLACGLNCSGSSLSQVRAGH